MTAERGSDRSLIGSGESAIVIELRKRDPSLADDSGEGEH